MALIVVTRATGAQAGGACPLFVIDGVVQTPNIAPGEPFGVTAYQCASCSFKREQDLAPEYSFNSEPIVLSTTTWSLLRVGDVIEAVNGQPIATRAGADQFTYPRAGETVLTVRRAGSRVEVKTAARASCGAAGIDRDRIESVEVFKGRAATDAYGSAAGNGVIQIRTKGSGEQTRSVRPELASSDSANESPTVGRYGFAISCLPSCTKARASDGTEYWTFDGYPPIAGIRPGGAAAMAGLQVGDVVTEIDGISILTEEGALRFQRAERKESLNVTVQRLGKRITYTLKPR